MMRPRSMPFRHSKATRLVAMVVATVHALLSIAPLADRADSRVAAVHVEQAGTSAHHAHGDLCALCAASHLVAPPGRAPAAPLFLRGEPRLQFDRQRSFAAADRPATRPRAPPV